MMLCVKNYCNLLIFGRVIVKIKRGGRFLRHSVHYNTPMCKKLRPERLRSFGGVFTNAGAIGVTLFWLHRSSVNIFNGVNFCNHD